jgi:hypothetical protein
MWMRISRKLKEEKDKFCETKEQKREMHVF